MSLTMIALRAFLAGAGLQMEVDEELRLHEGARYAMHTMGESARLAGFPGCFGESADFSPLNPAWTGPMRFAGVEGWNTQRPHPSLQLSPDGDAAAFRWSVTGCGVSGPPELRPPEAGSNRGLRGRLFLLGRRGNSPDSPQALFVRELSDFGDAGPARELVDGVESMRIRYRVRGDNAYLPAQQVQDWENVRELRIELRMSSLLVSGLNREFSQTISLRNRTIVLADFPSGGLEAGQGGDS